MLWATFVINNLQSERIKGKRKRDEVIKVNASYNALVDAFSFDFFQPNNHLGIQAFP
jgi:hypothetical protein